MMNIDSNLNIVNHRDLGIVGDDYITMFKLSNGQIIETRLPFLKDGKLWAIKTDRFEFDMMVLQTQYGVPRENFLYYVNHLS